MSNGANKIILYLGAERIIKWSRKENSALEIVQKHKKQTGFDWHEHEQIISKFWGSLCLMSVKLPVVCGGESVSELAVLSLRGLPDSSSLLSVAIVLWMVWYLMGIRVLLLLVTNINTVRLPL